MSTRQDDAETWTCGCYDNNGRNIHHEENCGVPERHHRHHEEN